MIGNYLSTFGVCVFAYLYPLFLCFKVCALSCVCVVLVVFRCFEISLIPSSSILMSPRFFPYDASKKDLKAALP